MVMQKVDLLWVDCDLSDAGLHFWPQDEVNQVFVKVKCDDSNSESFL